MSTRSAAGRGAATCDVWWVGTGRLDWRPLAVVLDAGETGRLEALRREADRERFVLAAALARAALGRRLGVPCGDVRLDRRCSRCGSPHGKPTLAAPRALLGVSITHSGGLVGVAVGDADVGLDVESAAEARDVAALARSVLTPGEQAALDRHAAGAPDPARRTEGFLRLWTRKEALTKMTGQGLTAPLDRIEVSGPAEPAALRSWAGQEEVVARTTLTDLPVPRPDHVAALAVGVGGAEVAQHDGAELLAVRSCV